MNILDGIDFVKNQNGGIAYDSTDSKLYNMFALGGAYRERDDEDCILLFKEAFDEDPEKALKCLFYLRDVRGGQGERRFFRVCMNWLGKNYDIPDIIKLIPEYGRFDDWFSLLNTHNEKHVMDNISSQLGLDMESETPSLLAKWLKSENASSKESREIARKTIRALGISTKDYRKMLSSLRKKINVLEKLMSANQWADVQYDKLPSRAGLIYRGAFANHDYERYSNFISSNKKVNAGALYPYDVVKKAINCIDDDICREAINKYWDNLTDYFNGASLNAICVVDTSGSMYGDPINIAISLGMYCAERNKGMFGGRYISFSRDPRLIKVRGIDFVDKVKRIYETNLCENTDIEKVFKLLLHTAEGNHLAQEDIPEKLVIISDMNFDAMDCDFNFKSDLENIADEWKEHGYKLPHLVLWNVNAFNDIIPIRDEGLVTYVSGASPVTFKAVLTGKTGKELMYDTLNSDRYKDVKWVHS